jgi:hypothetical protein
MGVRPNMPPPSRRRRSRPTSMIRIKTRSAKIVGTRPSTLFSVVTDKQLPTCGFHVERSYEWVKPREPKIFKIGHSPGQQLLTNHVNIGIVGRLKEDKGEELTVDLKCNAGPPYND